MSRKETRASKGAAIPYKRSDDYWGCSWTAQLPDGTSKRIVICAKTEAEVIAKRDEKQQELAKGEYVRRNGITLETWSKQWLEEYKKVSLSPNTYEIYEINLNYVVKTLGSKSIQKITDREIQQCINELSKKYAPATIKKIVSVVKQCFSQAVISRLISFSPAEHLKSPKLEKKVKKVVFSDEELAKLLEAAKNDKARYMNKTFYPALLVIVDTGCRRSEVLGLKWENVDTENDTIKIQDSVVQLKGKAYSKDTPKTDSSIREIPISKETMNEIMSLERVCEYVFHTREGNPITPRTFNRKFELWCEKAGIKHTPHELRHTFITSMINSGVSISNLQFLTGHATSRVLIEYAHAIPKESKAAMHRRFRRLRKIKPE